MTFQFKEKNATIFDQRGYFGIGIYNPKYYCNVGTLWRTAAIFGANFLFTIGEGRYKQEKADTTKSHLHIPLFHFNTIKDLRSSLHPNCEIVAVEMINKAVMLDKFCHKERAIYLLGSEDDGIPPETIRACNRFIKLPGAISLNVATAGSIVLYDRITKLGSNHE